MGKNRGKSLVLLGLFTTTFLGECQTLFFFFFSRVKKNSFSPCFLTPPFFKTPFKKKILVGGGKTGNE